MNNRLLKTFLGAALAFSTACVAMAEYAIPTVDLDARTDLQVIVDQEKGQYLGHPSVVLLEDGQTMYCVYPRGHGRGPLILKRSDDLGKTWSDRLPTPKSWETSLETPHIYRLEDVQGKKRLLIWSGLYPLRSTISEDDGKTWTELAPVGNWGGIVALGSQMKMKEPGHYMGFCHDDGRFIGPNGKVGYPAVFTVYSTETFDGGLTWSAPRAIRASSDYHICEPGVVRSPDGKQIAMLLRENSRRHNSQVIFSDDEGLTWSTPKDLPLELTGDRHTPIYTKDGRLYVSFREITPNSAPKEPTSGDWIAWVGTYEDLLKGGKGQYRIRLKDNKNPWDCAYPATVLLPTGEILDITYGHWQENEPPYILGVRVNLDEIDKLVNKTKK